MARDIEIWGNKEGRKMRENRTRKLSYFWNKILLACAIVTILNTGISTSPILYLDSFGNAKGYGVKESMSDLTSSPSDITFSNDQPMQFETITIYATVFNIGDANASDIVVRFYDIYGNFTNEIGDTLISSIETNSSQQTHIEMLMGPPGIHEIKVCVDPDDTITELNETNNCASRDLIEQRFYITCEDNAHTVPPGQSTEYLITIKDNQWDYCIHNFSLEINLPIFFSEWNATLSVQHFDSGGGLTTNVTLTVEVPETTMGGPSAGLTAPICVEATMGCPGELYNETHSVCTYTTASEESKQPPIADAGTDQTVNEGDVVQFNGSGSYDPDSRDWAWVNKSNIPTDRVAAAGGVLNDKLYVIGGGTWLGFTELTNIVEVYDPSTDSWANETPIFEPHSYMGVGVVDGKLYAMGGQAVGESQTTNLEFDPTTHTWTNKSSMPFERENFAVAVVNDKIYVIGGSNNLIDCPTLDLVEEYDPATDNWTRKADMPSPREGLAAAVYDNKIYAIGGHAVCPGDPHNMSIVEIYDPATDTWTSASPIPTGRSGLKAEMLENKIYAIGGFNLTVVIPEWADATDVNEIYDPETDTWSSAEPMWETRSRFVSAVINDRIYVVAGHSAGMWAPFPEWSEEYGLSGELQYVWDFDASYDSDGDGNYTNDIDATGLTPTHIYYDDGIYVVTLKVTDAEGLSDWDICNITVLNVPPLPEWTSRSADGTILNPPYPEGKEVLFEATVCDPGIYDTFTYDWDFGDGTVLLNAGPTVIHAYGDNKTYIVVLTVTDDDGGVGTDDTPPLVTTNEDPVASIDLPRCPFFEGRLGCPIYGYFTDPGWLDTHSAEWNFGDGEYETAVIMKRTILPTPPEKTTPHIHMVIMAYTISPLQWLMTTEERILLGQFPMFSIFLPL